MKSLEIYIDGASQGNPGHSGIGVILLESGQAIKNISRYIGNATNNVAEYTALIYGLEEALFSRAEQIIINTDSELLCKQITKDYKVKSPSLLGLYNQALHLLGGFKKFSIRHIPREQNKGADKLATKAIEEELKKASLTI